MKILSGFLTNKVFPNFTLRDQRDFGGTSATLGYGGLEAGRCIRT